MKKETQGMVQPRRCWRLLRASHGDVPAWEVLVALRVAAIYCVLLLVGCSGERESADVHERTVFPVTIIDEADLDIGTIWVGSKCSRTLSLFNSSSRQIAITQFAATCGCTSIEPSSLLLSPKSQRDVEVTFSTSAAIPVGNHYGNGPNFSVAITPMTKDNFRDVPQWKVTGIIRTLFTPAVSCVQFDDVMTRGQPRDTKTLTLISSVPLRSLELRGNAAFAKCDLTCVSKTDYVLSVKPRDDLPVGRFQFDVQLMPRLLSGKAIVLNPTRIEGVVSAEIDASPSDLSWGGRKLGSIQEAKVLVRSRCGQAFRITSITTDSGDTTVRTMTSSGHGVVLLVRHKISAVGQQEHHVIVTAEVDEGSTIDVEIPIVYCGYDVG